MLFNLIGGGSGGIASAYVTFPAYSVLAWTNGSISKVEENSSTTDRKGYCIKFPTIGTWTISATSMSSGSSDTVSQVLSVTNGKSYKVDLYYKTYMIKDGTIIASSALSYNDSTRILINRDYQGNPKTPTIPNTIEFSVNDWGGHHALVMFSFDVTNYARIVLDQGRETGGPTTPDGYPTSGELSYLTWLTEFATMTPINYPPDTSIMSNQKAYLMFDRYQMLGTGRGQYKNQYYYLDVSDLTGNRFISLGWHTFNGYRNNITVRSIYGEK